MFCTSKEQETCDVEKRGCEGCYYNKDGDYMNEEEIMEKYKNIAFEYGIRTDCDGHDEDFYVLRKMLEMYDQEKEKNKKLEEERLTGIQVKCMQDEAYIKARADFERDYKKSSQLYEKVIDMMAKQISCLSRNLDIATNFERASKVEYNVDFIKQYYFKKARGEENETN